MSGLPRYVDSAANEALDSLAQELAPWWGAYSLPLRVLFPDMNVARDIAHGLGVVPDGYVIVYADAEVCAEPGVPWTDEIAFLRAGAMDARATIIFFTLRQGTVDARRY